MPTAEYWKNLRKLFRFFTNKPEIKVSRQSSAQNIWKLWDFWHTSQDYQNENCLLGGNIVLHLSVLLLYLYYTTSDQWPVFESFSFLVDQNFCPLVLFELLLAKNMDGRTNWVGHKMQIAFGQSIYSFWCWDKLNSIAFFLLHTRIVHNITIRLVLA